MTLILKSPANEAEYQEISKNSQLCQEIVDTICQKHNLSGPYLRYSDGTQIVFSVADKYVVKIFPPMWQEDQNKEHQFLSHLQHKCPIKTPAVLDRGDLQQWPYVIMEKIPGVLLDKEWQNIPNSHRIELCFSLGQMIRKMHQEIDPAGLPIPNGSWEKFVTIQRQNCVARQQQLGLGEDWLQQIPEYLQVPVNTDVRVSVLHTELMKQHLLVDPERNWEITGLIDFESALVGAPEYEFPSFALFISEGNPEILRAFFSGYGYELDKEKQQQIMCYLLLHRYCHIPWYLKRLPKDIKMQTLLELQQYWFPLE